MKTYNLHFDQSLSRLNKKLNNEKLLTKNNWVIVDDLYHSISVYFFGKNNELIISTNGITEKGVWYYMGKDKLVIEENGKSFLFELCFFDNVYLVLKLVGCNDYTFFVNEKGLDQNQKFTDIIKYIENRKNPILAFLILNIFVFLVSICFYILEVNGIFSLIFAFIFAWFFSKVVFGIGFDEFMRLLDRVSLLSFMLGFICFLVLFTLIYLFKTSIA